jgi:hypothetical protein
MAHLTSIAAAMFTDLSAAVTSCSGGVAGVSAIPATPSAANFNALFVTATSIPTYLTIGNARSFPAVGAPANIVNVPVFGQRTSQTVGGQADAPSLEVTVNYIPNEWQKGTSASTFVNNTRSVVGTEYGNMIGDGKARVWRMVLMAAQISITQTASLSNLDGVAGAIGTVANSQFYWLGKLESLLVTPSLTDATTATLAYSVQSDFYGPFTI